MKRAPNADVGGGNTFLMGTMFSGAYYQAKGADFRLTQLAQPKGLL